MKMLFYTYVNLKILIVCFCTGNKNPNNNFTVSVIITLLFVKLVPFMIKCTKLVFVSHRIQNVLLFYDILI